MKYYSKKIIPKIVCFLSVLLLLAPIHIQIDISDGLSISSTTYVEARGTNGTQVEAVDNANQSGTNEGEEECGFTSLEGAGQCIINALGAAMINLAGMFTWAAAQILDISIRYTVAEFGENMTGNLGVTVNEVWVVIRDICNLAFIFGFIYLGIRTILDPDSAQVKRYLSKIIIGALLINFSLFFAKIIIDFSNILGVQIYNEIIKFGGGEAELSDIAFQVLGLATLYSNNGIAESLKTFLEGTNSFTFFLIASVFLLITAFVFLTAAILLVVRFVHLIFIMIASPILFGATVFPQTEKYSSELWKKLINYSIFLPAYLLMLFISFKAILVLGIGDNATFSNALLNGGKATESRDTDIFVKFLIAIFFMISSLGIAQKVGIYGADTAIKVGHALRKNTQSYVGRRSVGKLSNLAKKGYDRMEASDPNSKTGRAWKYGRGAAAVLSAGALTDRNIRGTLEAGEKNKFGGSYSFDDDQKYEKDRNKRISDDRARIERETALKNNLGTINNTNTSNVSSQQLRDAVENLGKTVGKMSDAERADIDIKNLTNQNVAINLSEKNIEALEKSGNFSNDDIQKIKAARKSGLMNIANHGTVNGTRDDKGVITSVDSRLDPASTDPAVQTHLTEQRKNILSGPMDAVGKLPPEVFSQKEMAKYITPAMIEARMKAGAKDSEINAIKDNIKTNVINVPTPNIQLVKMWNNWVDKTTYGGQFGTF